MADEDALRLVSRAVAARRGKLGMTQQDLADAAGVDLKTVYNLESGTRWPIARNRVAVSAALGWEGDGLAALRAGDMPAGSEPLPAAGRSGPPEPRYGNRTLDYLWHTPGLTEAQCEVLIGLARTWVEPSAAAYEERRRA